MSGKPEISAVLLSMGEPTLERALASIARQSHPVAEVVRVDGVAPFHRALNEGAARVRTEHFVQVDADMVLDDDCIERLAACTAPTVGAVIGMLRDPLYGRVQAIKLFRTAEVASGGFDDSISPDTDFLARMERHGHYMVYALRHDTPTPDTWHTFGEHRPEYEPLYTFEKNKRDGRRLRHRGDAYSVRYHLDLLHRSAHPCALTAEVAMAHGLFSDWEGDRQDGRCQGGPDFELLSKLLPVEPQPTSSRHGASRASMADARALAGLVGTAERVFRRSYAVGSACARAERGDHFAAALAARHRFRHPWAWIAQAALCRGLFSGVVPEANVEDDWRALSVFARDIDEMAPLTSALALARRLAGRS
jgi:hypothetical protein